MGQWSTCCWCCMTDLTVTCIICSWCWMTSWLNDLGLRAEETIHNNIFGKAVLTNTWFWWTIMWYTRLSTMSILTSGVIQWRLNVSTSRTDISSTLGYWCITETRCLGVLIWQPTSPDAPTTTTVSTQCLILCPTLATFPFILKWRIVFKPSPHISRSAQSSQNIMKLSEFIKIIRFICDNYITVLCTLSSPSVDSVSDSESAQNCISLSSHLTIT